MPTTPDPARPDETRRPLGFARAVAVLTAVEAVALFLAWCVLDWVLVRSPRYPSNVRDYDWVGWLAIAAVVAFGYVVAGHLRPSSRIGVALLSAALALPVTFVLVLSVGIPFHFRIGGRL